jgi:hypothetical protein
MREAPDDVFRAVQEARHRNAEMRIDPVRTIGDAVLSAFFAEAKPRAREKERVLIESKIIGQLEMDVGALRQASLRLVKGAHPIHPFHWHLEFPEVFEGENPGFDAIVGNPPFAGKNTMAAATRAHYPVWLQTLHAGAHGNSDIVAHFFCRAFNLLKKGGTLGLIATNTIGQGDTRATGLATILQEGGAITHARRRLKWPGEAAVVVSVVHVRRGIVGQPVLDGRQVRRISAYLVAGDLDTSPRPLVVNTGKAFLGSIVLGMGFTFDDAAAAQGTASSLADMERLIAEDRRNAEHISPYIGGEEVNNNPRHAHRRYVIDFGEMSEMQARDAAPDLMRILETRVRPERQADKREAYRRNWWRYAERRARLYSVIAPLKRVLAIGMISPHMSFTFLPTGMVYTLNITIVAYDSCCALSTLQSRNHEIWARNFSSTLEDRIKYSPADAFRTFPFPPGFENDAALEATGAAYHDHRARLMIARNEGLTKIYNRFHDPNEKSSDIAKLRELHDAMDGAVLIAYGWSDLAERIASDPGAMPHHLTEDTEDDHKFLGRYFWPAPIRDEVLARLLALNTERAEQEHLAGLTPAASEVEGDDADEADENDDEAA